MISREIMESALRHDGEPFEDEELEEMMSTAVVETSTGSMVIPYELYINKILVLLNNYIHFLVVNDIIMGMGLFGDAVSAIKKI